MLVSKILGEFEHFGYKSDSLISKPKMLLLLRELFRKNAVAQMQPIKDFDPDVADDLWEECSTNSKEQVVLIQYVEIILKAQDTLRNKIDINKAKIQTANKEREQYQGELRVASEKGDTRTMNYLNEKINRKSYQINKYTEQIAAFHADLDMVSIPFEATANSQFRPSKQALEQSIHTQVIQMEKSQRITPVDKEYNWSLRLLFWLCVLYLLLELMVELRKYSFLNTLVAVSLFSIFTLNFFDALYNKLVMALLLVSAILDVFWLIMHNKNYWNATNTSVTSLNSGFLKTIVIFVYLILLLKMGIFYILLTFRNSPPCVYLVQLAENVEIKVGGQEHSNPITPFLQ